MSYKVYDISRAQKGLKIADLKAKGCKGVIIRLGVGDSAKYQGGQDTASDDFVKQCEACGMLYGFYNYSYALTIASAEKEINMFIGLIMKYKKNKYFKMPCFFDMEEPEQYKMLTKKQRTTIIQTWLNACAANSIPAAIYGNPSFLTSWITVPKNAKVWLAHYFSEAPDVKSSYISKYNTIGWQYGVDNVNGYGVDINEWYEEYAVSDADKPKPTQPVQTAQTLKVGDKVKVDLGATTYDGRGLASFVYVLKYEVMQINDDRIVIGQNGQITAAVNAKDLKKI